MRKVFAVSPFWLFAQLAIAVASWQAAAGAEESDFAKHVKPLLAKHCRSCHQGAKAKAGLDLTTKKKALRGSDGGPVIVPGKPQESLLIQRVANGSMPPENDGRALTSEEVAVLSRWILSGAK